MMMNRDNIRLCIIPTYQNDIADVYYMFNNKRFDKTILDTIKLDEKLKRLKADFNILQIEILCENTNVISDFYFTLLYYLLKSYSNKIILTTNLRNPNKGVINYCDVINVNLNFNNYINEKSVVCKVIKAISSDKVINVKTLDICCESNPDKIIEDLNNLKIKSWEIIPYHAYVNSNLKAKEYTYFESIIKKYLFYTKKMKFAFQNKLQLDDILKIDNYNVKTVYITPNNNFGVLDFTKNNEFQILEYDNYVNYTKKLQEMEKIRDIFCSNCNSKLRCLSNRYLNLNYAGKSCSGFKDLIDFYNK